MTSFNVLCVHVRGYTHFSLLLKMTRTKGKNDAEMRKNARESSRKARRRNACYVRAVHFLVNEIKKSDFMNLSNDEPGIVKRCLFLIDIFSPGKQGPKASNEEYTLEYLETIAKTEYNSKIEPPPSDAVTEVTEVKVVKKIKTEPLCTREFVTFNMVGLV